MQRRPLITNPIERNWPLLLVSRALAVDVEAAGASFDRKKARSGSVAGGIRQDAGLAALDAGPAEVYKAASRKAS